MDALFALPFDAAMAGRTAEQFVQEVLRDGLGAAGVVVGPDFEFGKGRGGNLARLRAMGAEQGFFVTGFDMVRSGAEKISSTRIRDLLAAAQPQEAARLLGRYWAVEARVQHGDKRGRTMGFPTANMHLGHCFQPAFGVYAVRVTVTDNEREVVRRDGVANYGIRPMYETKIPLMEAHLFDFDGDLYGKHLMVELIAYIRPEAKFEGLPALIAQIGRDAEKARELLKAEPKERGAIPMALLLAVAPIPALRLSAPIPARAATQDADDWTPNGDMLSEMDSAAVQLRLAGLNAPLETYQRYYRGTMRNGRLFVEGYFGDFRTEGTRSPDSDDIPAQVHIVTSATPAVTGAGCRVVFLLYDVSRESFTSIQCQGAAAH